MARKNGYDEGSVVAMLSRKAPSIKINIHTKYIEVDKLATNIGIHSWGKIDYLVHYKGYVQGWFLGGVKKDADEKKKGKKKGDNNGNGKKPISKKAKTK